VPQETPEHNARQARFLDDDFCRQFACAVYPNLEEQLRDDLKENRTTFGRRFESPMIVYALTGSRMASVDVILEIRGRLHETIAIEIKPTVGDDFPAVLRQMHFNGSKVLFVGSYTGVGTTRERFVRMMEKVSVKTSNRKLFLVIVKD
jgi:hypothetical protein